MKHFYNQSLAANTLQPAANVLGKTSSKIFTVLLLSFFLLVSGESVGATFTARASTAWNLTSTWTKSGADGGTTPGPNDIVNIEEFNVTVTENASCSQLNLTGNGSGTYSFLINKDAKLIVGNLNILSGGNRTRNVNVNGELEVLGNLSIGGNSDDLINLNVNDGLIRVNGNLTNTRGIINGGTGKIVIGGAFQNSRTFNKGTGTVEYSGTGSTQAITNLGYHNLILSGTGTKTVSAPLAASGNLTVNGNANFETGNFSHTITGNLTVQSATAGITGNSTVGGTNLTVGGNLNNNGAVTFQSRNLIVTGNFNNNLGGTFTTGSGIHTVSGNWTNAGTLNAGTSTIVLNGASKTISSTGTGVFNNLTISTGAPVLLSDITVNSSLVVNGLILDTKNQKLVLGPAASLGFTETAAQHILGTIETTRLLPANRTSTEFFGNIGFRIPEGTADLGSIKVRRVTGKVYVSPITGYSSVTRQYYVSSESGLPAEGLVSRVEMNFPDYELEAGAKYTMYRVTGSNNEIVESLTNSFADDSNYRYRLNNAQKFGMYTISNTITPLPVELISFKAQRQAKGVSLTWATASEQDNSGFEVEVSTDSRTFQKIGFVESKVGTTSIRQNYSFMDTKGVSGTRYYRLKQIDLDGKFEYSAIRAVSLDKDNGVAAAYPNPFDDVVTVKLTGTEARQVSAVLTDAMGKVMMEQSEETAGNTISVNTGHVTTKGLYVLHVLDNGTKHTFKLIKR